jgi:hypothetical protein
MRHSSADEYRMYRIVERVQSLLKGPVTRVQYQEHIAFLLDDAAHDFCEYLYAEANGRRVAAAKYLEWARGVLEYELPLGLLQPIKHSRDRETALKAIMLTLPATVNKWKTNLEDLYSRMTPEIAKSSPAWKRYLLKRPLVRPSKQRLQEFSAWVDYIVTTTFQCQDSFKTDSGPKKA